MQSSSGEADMKKNLIILGVVLLLVLGCDLAVMRAEDGTSSGEMESAYQEIDTMIRGGRTEDALRLLEKGDTESPEYYAMKELAYIEDGSEKADEALSDLYREAADRWPEWQHMQKMAGVTALLEGNYKSAAYRLFQALVLDPEDAEAWYYMGRLSYCEGNYEDMRMYFEYALERNLSETRQKEILWYAEQAGDRA